MSGKEIREWIATGLAIAGFSFGVGGLGNHEGNDSPPPPPPAAKVVIDCPTVEKGVADYLRGNPKLEAKYARPGDGRLIGLEPLGSPEQEKQCGNLEANIEAGAGQPAKGEKKKHHRH